MLTQCPNCGTIYQLGASDLSAAGGYVECGECATQFNALERLADEPRFSDAPVRVQEAPPQAPAGPAFMLLEPGDLEPGPDAPDSDAAAPPSPDDDAVVQDDHEYAEPTAAATSGIEAETAAAPPPAETESPAVESFLIDPESIAELTASTAATDRPDASVADTMRDTEAAEEPAGTEQPDVPEETGPAIVPEEEAPVMAPLRPATSVLDESEHAILFTEPDTGEDDTDGGDTDEADQPDKPESVIATPGFDDVPEVIRREVSALSDPPRRRLRWGWVLLAVTMTALLALQLAFVQREVIVAVFPGTASLFDAACKRFACAGRAPRPAAIELLARDVRDHPQYEDTLLVNATLVSRAEAPVPFPVIQLGLQGPTGDILGVRRFEPSEYLDKSIDIAAGMPPNRAVYIVLEVARMGDRAASFEFTFL